MKPESRNEATSLSNNKKKAKGLFNLIAPIYGMFYKYQKKHFGDVIDVQSAVDFTKYNTVLDVGSGTGVLCDLLSQRGLSVTGIDSASKMLSIARKNNKNSNIEFIQASALEEFPFKAKSFDISIASYVAHGMSPKERETMYSQMSRVTKHLIIIYDYNEKRSALISFIEWLERGDYFNFIKRAEDEMKTQFSDAYKINVDKRAAWYLCTPTDGATETEL